MVEGEGQVYERLFSERVLTPMVFFDNIVDLTDSRANQEREEERENVPVPSPEEDVDGVE